MIRLTQSAELVELTSRTSTPASLARCGALTYVTGSSLTPPNIPFSTDSPTMRVS